jgi:hypothetical protein
VAHPRHLPAAECIHLLTSLRCGVLHSMNHSPAPRQRLEAVTNIPHTPVRRHHRPPRRVVQGGLGTTRPVRTALRLRFGLTSSATQYPLPQLIRDNSPPARVDPLPCPVSLLRTIQVKSNGGNRVASTSSNSSSVSATHASSFERDSAGGRARDRVKRDTEAGSPPHMPPASMPSSGDWSKRSSSYLN